MESNKLKNIVPLSIEIVAIDPDHVYSSEYEDSDCSDSEAETRNYATERNINKNPEVQPTSEPQSSVSQTATDLPQSMSYTSRFDEKKANATTPTTDVTTSGALTPDVPTSGALTPDVPTAELPTPDVPTAELPTSDVPATSEALDPQSLNEPVELMDGLFDFVTFNIDEDVVLQDGEQDDKHFNLEAYITDQSESPTSSSQDSGTSSISSSPGNSASPISSPQEIQPNNPNGNTTVSNTGFGIGQGKNFAVLMKYYNKDKPVFQKSKEDTENKVKSLAKSVKEGDMKMTKAKDLKQIREKDLKPVKREDVRPVKEKRVKVVKEKDVKPIKMEKVKPAKEKLVKQKDLKPANGRSLKLLKGRKVKPNRENELKPARGEGKPSKENKEQITQKIIVNVESNSSGRKTHIATQNSPNGAEDVNNNLDDFAKAILASMVVTQRKPNLEKRRNSTTRKRIFHIQEHSLKFQQYLNDKQVKPKMNVLQPSMAQERSNPIPTLTSSKIPKTTNAINVHLKTPPQLKQNIGNANSVALKTHPQQQHQNVKIENCSLTENSNTVDLKTSPQQQHQSNKTKNCDHKEAPTGTRKISIHEYLNRKRSRQSSNNGSDVDIDSNIPTKKRISINEYMKRRVQHEGAQQLCTSYTPSNVAPVTKSAISSKM